MMMNVMNRDRAAALFLEFVIERARNGVIKDVQKRLSEAPAGKRPTSVAVARHEWFRGLDAEDRSRVSDIIRESVDSAIFGVLVILDGLSGGNPVDGVASDFSLALQTYADDEARGNNAAEISVRINPSDTTEPLHDLYRWKVEETPAE